MYMSIIAFPLTKQAWRSFYKFKSNINRINVDDHLTHFTRKIYKQYNSISSNNSFLTAQKKKCKKLKVLEKLERKYVENNRKPSSGKKREWMNEWNY